MKKYSSVINLILMLVALAIYIWQTYNGEDATHFWIAFWSLSILTSLDLLEHKLLKKGCINCNCNKP